MMRLNFWSFLRIYINQIVRVCRVDILFILGNGGGEAHFEVLCGIVTVRAFFCLHGCGGLSLANAPPVF